MKYRGLRVSSRALRVLQSATFMLCFMLTAAGSVHAAPPEAARARFVPADSVQPAAPLQMAAIDFLLPGYGMYRHNETGYAALYFSSNLVNLGLIYVAYRNWQFYESAYVAAELRQRSEPDPLQFADPAGGSDYLSLQDIKNRAERGQLFFAVSIVTNVALRFLSATHTWSLADAAKRRSGPRYEMFPDATGGLRAAGMYSFYF
ncbi:hypothetical protein [Turneriella parva]|uniref:DUF5683 domain-containing protein n=1 Tax=Turneriella parva (strain ATCC BAA-1111 / DSM 21527 / NCTC 11395 / H) TaxID=869212 RepID=I4B171_TURPD|nr:hypothetical protein [Turneriella parva]AFM11028.1 hypothetical protein Turpa_0372 [Turneriella parva DSM 21527]